MRIPCNLAPVQQYSGNLVLFRQIHSYWPRARELSTCAELRVSRDEFRVVADDGEQECSLIGVVRALIMGKASLL